MSTPLLPISGPAWVREHMLKTWPAMFAAAASNAKRFEVRENDRDYLVGDVVVLAEWDPSPVPTATGYASSHPNGATGRFLRATITFVLRGGQFGLPEHLCVFGVDRWERAGRTI